MPINLTAKLKEYFGFDNFRAGQREVLDNLIQGKNTLAVLPTGGGKTLTYQMYGLLSKRTIIIVSPLISLMQDQVSRLQFMGSRKVVALTSAMPYSERQAVLDHLAQYQYIYVSPEMLANNRILAKVSKLHLGLFVIDEAHCVSEWGPDFRPDYLKLGGILKSLGNPLTLMLTATAQRSTISDIKLKLGFQKGNVANVILPNDRPNIFLAAKSLADNSAKNSQLIKIVTKLAGAGIVYFSSKKATEKVADLLNRQTNKRAMAYHGGMDASNRYKIQQQFMLGNIDVVCATSAFGMGIDKSNIRYVIHYHIPGSIEDYVQEIGRCGRDQQPAIAILLFEPNDELLRTGLIEGTIPDPKVVNYFYDHPNIETNQNDFRVLKYYSKNGYSADQVNALFKQRYVQRVKELRVMEGYLVTQGCRRTFIADHFKTSPQSKLPITNCCDFHNDFWSDWQAFCDQYFANVHSESPVKFAENWHDIIDNLFLLKN